MLGKEKTESILPLSQGKHGSQESIQVPLSTLKRF